MLKFYDRAFWIIEVNEFQVANPFCKMFTDSTDFLNTVYNCKYQMLCKISNMEGQMVKANGIRKRDIP